MCLRHPPKIVACVCIHLACKWSNYKIPLSKLRKEWFMHVLEPNWNMDSATTLNLLEELTNEFLTILKDIYVENCSSIKVKYNFLPKIHYYKTVDCISKNLIIKNQWRFKQRFTLRTPLS